MVKATPAWKPIRANQIAINPRLKTTMLCQQASLAAARISHPTTVQKSVHSEKAKSTKIAFSTTNPRYVLGNAAVMTNANPPIPFTKPARVVENAKSRTLVLSGFCKHFLKWQIICSLIAQRKYPAAARHHGGSLPDPNHAMQKSTQH